MESEIAACFYRGNQGRSFLVFGAGHFGGADKREKGADGPLFCWLVDGSFPGLGKFWGYFWGYFSLKTVPLGVQKTVFLERPLS